MTNPTGVMIKLNGSFYTLLFELEYSGDLFGAIGIVPDKNFNEVMRYIHSLLGLSNRFSKTESNGPLKILKKFSVTSKKLEFTSNRLYDPDVLNKFINGIHKFVIEEEISSNIVRWFHVMYDPNY
ncbi:hypothetical protein GIX76_08560 [Lactobacillus reuteri]|uniref:Uncharacterized protein n=2 Tax=Limosilactobacillus reuteri TaxID=1598 RepID=A0A7X2G1I3_LIMRT|nr:hypothetical protein [Limosilactobacillus reuteri]